jgi:hypothetical protein
MDDDINLFNFGLAECNHCHEVKPVCCDNASYPDGTHDEPSCTDCCGPHPSVRGRDYLRMDCDS